MIHVEFKDFQDMLSFARQLLGQVEVEKAMQPQRQPVMQQAPVVQTQPAAPVTPVQPAAPVTPVQPAAPVAPVQPTAPVAPAQPAAPTTPVQAAPMAPVQATVPTTSVTYTPDDLARAAFALMDSGRQQELIGLLQQFGVNAIPELKPEQFGAFATALRGMGAQI